VVPANKPQEFIRAIEWYENKLFPTIFKIYHICG
jgi:hypothetical protein